MDTQTAFLFRDDAYLKACAAHVVALRTGDGAAGVVLDRTVFYPTGGGQPGDSGCLVAEGRSIAVATTTYGATKAEIVHVLAAGESPPAPGTAVEAMLDWDLRYQRMRMHSALHLLSVVLPYPVTGGAIGHAESRLDFDIPEAGLDREALSAELNRLIGQNAAITTEWITDAELEANPALVKTMAVKPPMGQGKVRLVRIHGLDLQPCGGTHVANTAEIGAVAISAIEKKGKQNRRVRLVFA